MKVEEEYMDVLQNIESGIIEEYHKDRELVDYNVFRALEAAISLYKAQQRQQLARPASLDARDRAVFDAIQKMCEFRLGRLELVNGAKPPSETSDRFPEKPKALSVEEILLCLKRLQKSAEFWNKEGGRRGYLDYVSHWLG